MTQASCLNAFIHHIPVKVLPSPFCEHFVKKAECVT